MTTTALALACVAAVACLRLRSRRRRCYVRLLVEPYRADRARPDELARTLAALHALLAVRGAQRLLAGQPSLALEVHLHRRSDGEPLAWLAISAPAGLERLIEAALRTSYPNASLRAVGVALAPPPALLRLRRRSAQPPREVECLDPERPPVDGLLRVMGAVGGPAVVQLALTPAPRWREQLEAASPRAEGEREGDEQVAPRGRRGPLFYTDIRVIAPGRGECRAIAAELIAAGDGLVARRVTRGARYARRVARGEGNPLPPVARGAFGVREIAALWQLPSVSFSALPLMRRPTPLAPAPPGIARAARGGGLLRDEHGPVTIHEQLRCQNTAVVGTVGQGKTSYLVATVEEDLARGDCAVIVLDPKGDAAAAALSAVPRERRCTLLDMARPTCGFNPLALDAAPDAIADHVVAALRQLFAEGEVRGSSDRYLRNALIAVLAYDRRATLWDVARLLEVGAEAAMMRERVAHRLATLPEYAEVTAFLSAELPAQLAGARASTTAKLDAPANKLARVLNSSAVKRVLLNTSLVIDFDDLIEQREVLIVRGALGELGAGNVAVLMQLLLGMLDAALGRRQDRHGSDGDTAVALKVDEAPLVINAAFAQTLALKRSAGLETVACWQTDAQWPPELREQLDALFAHRVLFATASAQDARSASALLLAEYADQLRAGDERVVRLAQPDVRLHLPRHTAIASWTTWAGRQRPFIARTRALAVDPDRIAHHTERQRARGGRALTDLAPPPAVTELQSPTVVVQAPPAAVQSGATAAAPASYAELTALDAASRVRWLPCASTARKSRLDAQELELLSWIAAARCVLTSQVHRRFNPGSALTTTQRRLKRLADRGLIARFQLHRDDGGGVPLCCTATAAAHELLGLSPRRAPARSDAALAGLRADVHTVGWLLAVETVAGGALRSVLGPGRARIAPPEGAPVAPAGLPLELGLTARDFAFSDASGSARPVERFAAVVPHAVAELRTSHGITDLLVLREPVDPVSMLERCDHLVSGWWRLVPRYVRLGRPPLIVVVCSEQAGARALAELADGVLRACLARLGTPPQAWAHPGRTGICFAAEPDLHEQRFEAWRVPPLPPQFRAGCADASETAAIAELDQRGAERPLALAHWH